MADGAASGTPDRPTDTGRLILDNILRGGHGEEVNTSIKMYMPL